MVRFHPRPPNISFGRSHRTVPEGDRHLLGGKDARPGGMLGRAARWMLLCAAVAAGAGCGGTSTEQVIGPTASRCQITLPSPPAALPASGSSVSLNVSAARDCTWTAASDAQWVTVTPTSGQGNGAVSITVAPNVQPSARSASVAVNEASVTVSQEPAPCRFELGDQSARVGFEGGRASVHVLTTSGCQWRAAGSAAWLRILTTDGVGSGTVDIDVSRNDGPERSVTLSIAGSSFVLAQDAPPAGVPQHPTSCSFSIDPEGTTIRSAAGQGSVRVLADPGCPWTAASQTSWISVQRSTGSGPEVVTYQFSANLSTTSERSGGIAIAGRTHRVTQQACGLSIDSGVPNFPPAGGDGDFRVTTDAGCVWNATTSNPDWIVLIRSSAAGSNVVTYKVAPNPVARDRSATITVSGRTKTVIQQALGQGGP